MEMPDYCTFDEEKITIKIILTRFIKTMKHYNKQLGHL